jgi:hypothetical protein
LSWDLLQDYVKDQPAWQTFQSIAERESLTSKVRMHVMELEDFEVKCPTCQAPFDDFHNVFLLKCKGCSEAFCGWCFQKKPSQFLIEHVLSCSLSKNLGSIYGDNSMWEESKKELYSRFVQWRLKGVSSKNDMNQHVLSAIAAKHSKNAK